MTRPRAPLPVTVVGGYLGAGKTTLVNHLLRNAQDRRFAVLVNDFGTLEIDAALIEARSETLISLAGGCICCSYGSDLMDALLRLAALDPRPDQVLIETSGVALPGGVARSVALLQDYRIDAVVVLVDAETVRKRAADRYMGDTVRRQLEEGDLLLVNRIDLVGPAVHAALGDWLATAAPSARAIACTRAAVPAEVVLGLAAPPHRGAATWLAGGRIRPPMDTPAFDTLGFVFDEPCDVAALAEALADPALGITRAKGILRAPEDCWQVLQMVGARRDIDRHRGGPSARGELVVIGTQACLDPDGIRARVAAAGGREIA